MIENNDDFLEWLKNSVSSIPQYTPSSLPWNDEMRREMESLFGKSRRIEKYSNTVFYTIKMETWGKHDKSIEVRCFRDTKKRLSLSLKVRNGTSILYHHSNPHDFLIEAKKRYKLHNTASKFGL